MINTVFCFFILSLNLLDIACYSKHFPIVGFFYPEDISQEVAYSYAVESINSNKSVHLKSLLNTKIERGRDQDNYHLARKTCTALQKGMTAIFGPRNIIANKFIEFYSSSFRVPHFETKWDFSEKFTGNSSFSLYPNPLVLIKAFSDLIEKMNWKHFALIYESNEDFAIKLLETEAPKTKHPIFVWQIKEQSDYSRVFHRIAKYKVVNIMVECKPERIRKFFKEALKRGFVAKQYNYIIMSLDLSIVNLEDFKGVDCSITAFRWIDLNQPELQEIDKVWAVKEQTIAAKTLIFAEMDSRNTLISNLRTDSILTIDAVNLFAYALRSLDFPKPIRVRPLYCSRPSPWFAGEPLIMNIRQSNFTGYSGPINFDSLGYRMGVDFDIIAFKNEGLEKIGTWNESFGINIETPSEAKVSMRSTRLGLKSHYKVVGVLRDPFLFWTNKSTSMKSGSLDGFLIDLLEALSNALNFTYEVSIVSDGQRGSYVNDSWNGMMGELMKEINPADMAIGDFTVTYRRWNNIRFTTPFMFVGIGVIYKTNIIDTGHVQISVFKIMSSKMWISLIIGFVATSVLLHLVSRFTSEEQIPQSDSIDPSDETRPKDFSFTPCYSLFFAFTSCTLQKSTCVPRCTATRVIAGAWWLFVFMLLAIFTANLTTYYIRLKLRKRIERPEDLAKQTRIKYGLNPNGFVGSFFRQTKIAEYSQMWSVMKSDPITLFSNTDEEGVNNVLRTPGTYAHLVESPIIDYVIESHCDLIQLGDLLNFNSYAIGLHADDRTSQARLSMEILRLRDTGYLHYLKLKWWRLEREDLCDEDDRKEELKYDVNPIHLQIGIMGGVFLILLIALLVGFLSAAFSYCWAICHDARMVADEPVKKVLKMIH